MRRWLIQRWCALQGHDAFMHFEDHRLSMKCISCGYETPGWNELGVVPTKRPVASPTPAYGRRKLFPQLSRRLLTRN
jgi:hypothetical protein